MPFDARLSPERLAELRRLHEEATPVGWLYDRFDLGRSNGNAEWWDRDTTFAAALRNEAPALLASAERAAELEERADIYIDGLRGVLLAFRDGAGEREVAAALASVHKALDARVGATSEETT